MAKPTPKKHYLGNIPFDVWGNQEHYADETNLMMTQLSPADWDGTDILERIPYGTPEYAANPNGRLPLRAFTHAQYQLSIYPEPRTVKRWGSDDIVVGEMKRIVWVPNYTFDDVLVYDTYSRGRSAAYFHFTSKITKRGFTVFLKDFEEGFVRRMERGEVSGRFTFCKRGSNYGTTVMD